MSVPVEAQSLSSLQYLLANPPQYPRNPTHELREPLVLYIVRVPGSKDVFLTPLKPPTKASISLEAIQTSLYYLHVESAEDENVRQSIDQENAAVRKENAVPTVHRKPVPHHDAPIAIRPGDSTLSSHAIPNASAHTTHGAGIVGNTSVVRKPLGPREHSNISSTSSLYGKEAALNSGYPGAQEQWLRPNSGHQIPYDENFAGQKLDDVSLPPPPPPPHGTSIYGSTELGRSSQSLPRSPLGNSPTRPSRELSKITVIRRDPVSGAQWNIGTITQLDVPLEANLRPISVELTTPGYGKFHNTMDVVPSGIVAPDAESIKKIMASYGNNATPEFASANTSTADTNHNFARTVSFRPQQLPPPSSRPIRLSRRTNSGDSFLNHSNQSKPIRNVFSFVSPWQSLCVFSNGIDGRSLKCRQMLANSSPNQAESEEPTMLNLAELRFNLSFSGPSSRDRDLRGQLPSQGLETDTLPISSLIRDKGGKESVKRGFQHIKNLSREFRDTHLRERALPTDANMDGSIDPRHGVPRNGSMYPPPPPAIRFQTTHDTSSSEHSDDNDPGRSSRPRPEQDRISLKLGREKAGGGFRGNSAKLGKLILENDGLKMGDLVVAACMGIWWQHYEASTLWSQ